MRRIVFCFDGSWNELKASKKQTNVSILAQSVVPEYVDASGKVVTQIVYYDEGVGTSSDDKFRGGILGQGLVQNITDAYRFLIFNYQPGDEIFAFGFSRGAFTAMSFLGFIRACGIISVDNAVQIEQALKLYRKHSDRTDREPWELLKFRADYAPKNLISQQDIRYRSNSGVLDDNAEFLKIQYAGVWDTVSSLGWQVFKQFFVRRRTQSDRDHDTNVSELIIGARHALALDEMRANFVPTLWRNLDDLLENLGYEADDRKAPYQQKWFPGDHSSVGGGGEFNGLSNGALQWVLDGAIELGLKVNLGWSSKLMHIRYDYRTSLESKPKTGVLHKVSDFIFHRSRSGPETIADVHPSALRRWYANPGELHEGKAYRPKTLRQLAKLIEMEAEQYAPPEFKGEVKLVTYVVQSGDTLSKIAREHLGDGTRYMEIFDLNRDLLDDPSEIYPGDELRIQLDEEANPPASEPTQQPQ